MENKTFRGFVRRVMPVLVLSAALAALSGCNKKSYNAVIKSGDRDLIYSEALRYYGEEKYSRSIYMLEMVKHYFNSTSRADSVSFYLASSYYKNGDLEMSGLLFDEFRQTYTLSPFLPEAEYYYARGFYFMSLPPERDQTNTVRALAAIDEFQERYPDNVHKEQLKENTGELMQKLHDKAYLNAKTYYKIGKYQSAIVSLKNALNKYPESVHHEDIMYLIVKSSYMYADNSVVSKQRDRYMDMMDSYYSFVMAYPESRYRKEVDKMQDKAKAYVAKYSDLESGEKEIAAQ